MNKAILFLLVCLLTVNISFANNRTDNTNFLTDIFTTEDGLSSTKITCITQDEKGFMWIGTEDGLNKFDGYHFTIYRKKENDTLSLVNDHITSLYTDSRGLLWIGTLGGLQFYDQRKDGFVSVSLHQPDYVIKNNQCHAIFEDRNGDLWFSSSGLGVLYYSPATEQSILLSPSHTKPNDSLCSDYIRCIIQDKEGNIWFGSQNKGLSVYNPEQQVFHNYNQANSNLSSNNIFGLNLSQEGNILIATIGGGITIYDMEKKDFISYRNIYNTLATRSAFCVLENKNGIMLSGSEGNGLIWLNLEKQIVDRHPVFNEYLQTIGDSKVHCLYENRNGDLWVGMNYKGICVIKRENNGFRNYRKVSNEPNSLSYDHVMGMTKDKEGNIWIATDGGGLNCYQPDTDKYIHYTYKENNKTSITDNAVVSVFCDSKNRIWAGTYTGGLCLLNKETGSFRNYKADNISTNALQSNFIKSIAEDKHGNLWLGTNGGGLTCFDPEQETFHTYLISRYPGLASDYITIVFVDSRERIWVGTYYGLSCMEPDNNHFIRYDDRQGLSDLAIYSIAEDSEGIIWIGTQNGLNKYDDNQKYFTHEFPQLKEYSQVINGIVPVNDELWLSTNNGILCLNAYTGAVKHYGRQHGLQGNEFILSSYYKDKNEEVFFGGTNGMTAFHPGDINVTEYTPRTYITNLRIFNQRISIGEAINGRVILKEHISNTKKIYLHSEDKTFTLEFTAPDALKPQSLVYACRMEGFDTDWVEYSHTRRFATYTNLNPGTYEFRVKATTDPSIWSDEYASLMIVIEPPLWGTWWARLLYVGLLCVLVYVILRILFIRVKYRNELQIEKLKVKQQEEVSRIRSDFYTNISHEFRTPLTLIISPLEYMLPKETDPEKKESGMLMLRNAKKLLTLINQLLELNKIEEGSMKIHVQKLELTKFISQLTTSFKDLAKQKNINFKYTSVLPEIWIWYEPDMLEKCINNLVSNAFKFTPEGGSIEIHIKQDEENGKITLSVSDTGIGMDEETRVHVFDRFYQSNKKIPGSGIGMHLTKSIVELHKGVITVESQEGYGSVFSITFLPGNEHFTPNEIVIEPYSTYEKNDNMIVHLTVDNYYTENNILLPSESSFANEQETNPLLLLIEDDPDMLRYIRNALKEQYQIIEAYNGKSGLEKAKKHLPDLIITDVLMPEMSGLELTRILKNDPETSHIPIIILTAQDDMEHRVEGLETGADSYIPKPFNPKHLIIRVQKLIELRCMMKERFSKSVKMDIEEMTLTGTDERLLQKAIDYVRNNIENPDTNVEAMSKELGLSRTHLHRKLKALTGKSPVEFIKMIRMKQAAYLLSTGKMSISEVGYKVGYSTPSYFSSSFNAHFGMSPTVYIEQIQKDNEVKQK